MFVFKSIALLGLILGFAQAVPLVASRQDIQLLLLCTGENLVDCLDFQVTSGVCCMLS